MRELCARQRARRRAVCGRASATVPARDGGRVPFLPSMAAALLSLASTESEEVWRWSPGELASIGQATPPLGLTDGLVAPRAEDI